MRKIGRLERGSAFEQWYQTFGATPWINPHDPPGLQQDIFLFTVQGTPQCPLQGLGQWNVH